MSRHFQIFFKQKYPVRFQDRISFLAYQIMLYL